MRGREWTRDELIVAFNLYCKTPFGRIHTRNPQILELAKAIGRTPSAVSWKLANFARLDPSLQRRNILGASHGAKVEKEIWVEFADNWEKLAFESERLLGKIMGSAATRSEQSDQFPEGKSREATVRARVNQAFFRAVVLSAYGGRCCITGLSIRQLLNASHIVPWSVDTRNRTNPRNGLCLNVIHDRAFDHGLLTVTLDMRVKLSPKLKVNSADAAARRFLWRYDGAPVSRPHRFAPDPDFLRYHNEKVFVTS